MGLKKGLFTMRCKKVPKMPFKPYKKEWSSQRHPEVYLP